MNRKATVEFARSKCVLAILPALFLILLWQFAAGASECQVDVSITGQLFDAVGQPVGGQELIMRFFVSPSKPDVEAVTTTDGRGNFYFQVQVPQHVYDNSGYRCAEIQGRIYVGGYHETLQYIPAGPQLMSEAGYYEHWAPGGAYEGSVLLFHSIRRDGSGDPEHRFDDLVVNLGSREQPLQLSCRSLDLPGETATLTVQHLGAQSGEPVAAPEHYTFTEQFPVGQFTQPKELTALAPLKVELDGLVVAEAEPDRPITAYQVVLSEPPASPQTAVYSLVYYYDRDRDGDGIPDYEVRSRYASEEGESITSPPEVRELYAYKEQYQGQPPKVTGYRYQGYEKDEAPLISGTPEEPITADTTFQYVYRRSGGSGGGGNGSSSGGDHGGGDGSGNPEPSDNPDPTEEIPPLTEEPQPPGEVIEPPDPDEELDVGPDPEPEPELDPEPDLDQAARPGNTVKDSSAPAAGQTTNLNQEEREALRNITFVKRSYRQQAAPGELITYSFTGFENAFPYSLKEFTLVDEPDLGLNLCTVDIPALAQGEGVVYAVVFTTNQRAATTLVPNQSAGEPLKVEMPPLGEEEYLTELSIQFGEVPVGFAQDNEIQLTFQVWDDPPAAELHNLGLLYYEDQGEKVSINGRQGSAAVTLNRNQGHPPKPPSGIDKVKATPPYGLGQNRESNSLSPPFANLWLILALCAAVTLTMRYVTKKK